MSEPLFKLVGGERIQCSKEEEDAIRASWAASQLEETRMAAYERAVADDEIIAKFKTMTIAEFDAWWTETVTGAQPAIAVLKRLAWLAIRRAL